MNNNISIKSFKKIAIIQTAFIGDVILTLPLVDTIKTASPDSEILFVTTPKSAELVSLSKSVSKVITYDKKGLHEGLRGIKFIAQLLIENNVDLIITPHRSLRSSLVTFYSKPILSITFNKTALSIIYDKRVKYKLHLHEIERNFDLLSVFSNEFELKELNEVVLDIHNEDKDIVDSLISKLDDSKPIIALAPGSVWQTKRWLPEYYSKIISIYSSNYNIILIGSKEDTELCEIISKNSSAINMAGKSTFAQTILLLAKCKLLITNDSSPTHFAGLANCPTLTLYGPTSPKYGFYPRNSKSKTIAMDELKCHPCHIHGKNTCPLKTHDCMKNLLPEKVKEISDKILNSNS